MQFFRNAQYWVDAIPNGTELPTLYIWFVTTRKQLATVAMPKWSKRAHLCTTSHMS